jgi:hypothetical protein
VRCTCTIDEHHNHSSQSIYIFLITHQEFRSF